MGADNYAWITTRQEFIEELNHISRQLEDANNQLEKVEELQAKVWDLTFILKEERKKIAKLEQQLTHYNTPSKIASKPASKTITHNNTVGANCTKIKCLETGTVFNSIAECAKEMNLNRTRITEVAHGKYAQHKGYHFELIEEVN